MSEGGLCLLSPVVLEAKEHVVIHIDVPPQGPVEVEAVAWHVRRVRSGNSRRKGFSIGMMLLRAGEGFQALLGNEHQTDPSAQQQAPQADDFLQELSLESEKLSPEWDQWSSEWDELFEESEKLLAASQTVLSEADLRVFRVRVKTTTGPRTRTFTLNATCEDDAVATVRRELGDDWKILELTPV